MVEVRDVSPRVIVRIAAIVFGLTFCTLLLATAQFGWLNRGLKARLDEPPPRLKPFPGPLLEVDAVEGLREQRRRDAEILRSYGWVDRERGLVRVPIDRAMDLLLERGLPVRK